MKFRSLLAQPIAFAWAAAICVLAGFLLVFAPFLGWPRIHLMKNMADLGSMIGGMWALAAGLMTVHAALTVSMQETTRARATVAAAALAQIQSAWNYVDALQVRFELGRATGRLEAQVNRADVVVGTRELTTYRGHLGNSWLTLQTASPDAFGALPIEVGTNTTEYFARFLNVIGRLNWLNDSRFNESQIEWVFSVHSQTLNQLAELDGDRENLVTLLQACLKR